MVTRLTKGRLKVTISETRAELGEVAAREVGAYIRSLLETKPEVNIIFASAPSQNDFLANLLLEEIDWSRVNAFHMDEYIGIDPHAPQAFGQFLRDRIFSKKTFKSVNYIDSKAADPAAECERYAGLLRQMPADIVFLGIGENGHLAFNEPQPELTAEQFAQLPTRVLDIHPETRATNCVGDLGGALEVRMDMQQGNYYEVTSGMDGLKNAGDQSAFNTALASASYTDATGSDYLTNLRMYFYIRAFAGVGFDVSVVAFKIGVFGQLNLDMQYKWLNRGYLEESSNISAVGPVSSRTDDVIQGSNLSVSGSTGIEFVFKFLFISYEKIFCSIGFESESDDPGWRTIEEIWKANKTINGKPVTRMAMPNGQVIYAVDLGAQLERRDYVDTAEQEWLGGRPSIGLFSLDKDQNATLAETLQIGAYSYANPVLSDDGEVMFYLSDREDNDPESALDIRNSRVH